MHTVTFVTDIDGRSGKVASQKTRTVIRAHVMRKHWMERFTASGPIIQPEIGAPSCPSSSTQDEVDTGDTTNLRRPESTQRTVAPADISLQEASLSRHLNRVTDDFVYAGSSIDMQSYGYFHHYSMEFSIILPNSVQPLPIKRSSVSCLAAIQQNSPILLDTICFMAAFHECMKRTKDSCGRLVTTFSDKKALRYKAAALQKLSDHLYDDSKEIHITEADILCVMILLFSETIAGDRPAVSAHLQGLTHMIRLHGGDDHLSSIAATNLQFATLLAAQLDQTFPILPLQARMQRRFDLVSSAQLPPEGEPSLGSSFFEEPLCYELSEPLQQCLRYMCQVIARIHLLQDSTKVLDGEWMDDVLTLVHVLISLPHGQQPLSRLEECIRLAALLYCNTALWKIPLYFRWVMALVRSLKAAYLAWDRSVVKWVYPGFRFWMLFLGRQACTLEFSALETAWWNAAINKIAVEHGVATWGDCEQVFQRHLYVDGTHSARWKAVWNDILQGTLSAEHIRDPVHPCDYI